MYLCVRAGELARTDKEQTIVNESDTVRENQIYYSSCSRRG